MSRERERRKREKEREREREREKKERERDSTFHWDIGNRNSHFDFVFLVYDLRLREFRVSQVVFNCFSLQAGIIHMEEPRVERGEGMSRTQSLLTSLQVRKEKRERKTRKEKTKARNDKSAESLGNYRTVRGFDDVLIVGIILWYSRSAFAASLPPSS